MFIIKLNKNYILKETSQNSKHCPITKCICMYRLKLKSYKWTGWYWIFECTFANKLLEEKSSLAFGVFPSNAVMRLIYLQNVWRRSMDSRCQSLGRKSWRQSLSPLFQAGLKNQKGSDVPNAMCSGGFHNGVWRIFGYSNIFEYFPLRIFVRIIFVSFFWYQYIRTFVRIVFFNN